ncbi:MAG: SHOCT domain-containing protein [Roseiflexaceae bacterium]
MSQLDALHAAGILSDEEYATKRQRITDGEV